MKQYNGTGSLFLLALAIIGIILYVAVSQYDIDVVQTIQFIGVK